jgi:preprotein translocase subunit SecY
VGLFSLGIIPYINSSIVLQLFSAAFPSLKKMQREDGPQGRARFQYYQKLAAFVFAIAQVRDLGGGRGGGRGGHPGSV